VSWPDDDDDDDAPPTVMSECLWHHPPTKGRLLPRRCYCMCVSCPVCGRPASVCDHGRSRRQTGALLAVAREQSRSRSLTVEVW